METKKSFNWFSLFIGILLVIVSLFAFRDPASDLVALVIFFGIMAIVRGLTELIMYFKAKDTVEGSLIGLIILGVLNIIFGIVLLTNIYSGLIALPFVFAIWFIIDSISGLVTAFSLRGGYFWFSVIMNILGIIVGVMLFFNPIASLWTVAFLVGIYFLFTGITYIVNAFDN